MVLNNLLPLFIVLSALLPGLLIFCIGEQRLLLRRMLNLGANIACIGLIMLLISGVYSGEVFETRLPLLPGMDLVLHADTLSLLFVSLSGLLWFLTTIYAIGYFENTENRSRFFGFFCLCVAATLGIALAGNLITFLIFYELLTLTTYPLVVHKGNAASLRAGRIYLTYTLIGGALLLAGVVWLKAIAGPLDFTVTGVLSGMPQLDPGHLKIIFALLIVGLGVKAALVPLHGWLPVAMAAPAPVSALLHAVAVVKAGAFGIIRVVYDVYGIEFARELGVTSMLAAVAAFTIVYGSVRALFQDDIKKRLAYSTVSQVSYIALGTAIAGPIATIGGMVHLVHQGLMKITMFFCAGNLAETMGIHKVSEMNGVGRRMPFTMAAFTIAALGMIGLPPLAGFVSKWYLGLGALEVGAHWVLFILAASSLLNAIYFLPMLYAAWFKPSDRALPAKRGITEAPWMLLVPPVVTAALALAVGVFANNVISPLNWAKLIATLEYGQVFERGTESIQLALPLLSLVVITPLLLALGLLIPVTRRMCIRLVPCAALPALAAALLLPDQLNILPGLFFGSVLSLDQTSQTLLLLAAILWLIAAIYGSNYLAGDKHLTRYTLYFLLCMTGSFGLTLSQDLFGFITFFTLMSFSAYGLVVHAGTDEAMRAGKTYMQWVVIGEVLLFAALIGLAINNGESPGKINTASQPVWVSWLLMLGFGIKAGLLATHSWLPRAHPVAPLPASALLSGLMVKAGLIGWWRFLPLGEVALEYVGVTLLTLGISGAFFAVAVGITQRNPKTLLAYSTISQMGIIATGVGAGLMTPDLWPLLSSALLLYAIHHGLAKAALFLSVGVAPALATNSPRRWLVWAGILIPAMAMVGLPFTSGALAKSALKTSLVEPAWITDLLLITAIGTTLLMLRFVDLLRSSSHGAVLTSANFNSRLFVYGMLVLLVVIGVYWLPQADPFIAHSFSYQALWSSLWPPIVGALIFLVAGDYFARSATIPAGDVIVFVEKFCDRLKKILKDTGHFFSDCFTHITGRYARVSMVMFESRYSQLMVLQVHPGVAFVGILLCFFLLLVVG